MTGFNHTDDEWNGIAMLIQGWWPGQFSTADELAWRLGLDDYELGDLSMALKAVALNQARRGEKFRPSLPEVLAQLESDPSRPTFEEAYRLIFGPDGICASIGLTGTWSNYAERAAVEMRAREAICQQVHPLVGSFAMRYGLERLMGLEVNDPDWGEKRRADLHAAWDRHVEAMEDRDVAALVSGRTGELRRFDPLAAITGPVRELESGNEIERTSNG